MTPSKKTKEPLIKQEIQDLLTGCKRPVETCCGVFGEGLGVIQVDKVLSKKKDCTAKC